jgi:hypothetical protein
MRSSDWKITWDPADTGRVLLDYDDLMDSEIRLGGEQLVTYGQADFALRRTAISRKNAKRRLEFGRRLPHATGAASWLGAVTGLMDAPWNLKGTLRIQPRGGDARNYTAVLLGSTHRPSLEDGFIESIHSYTFRVIPA